MTAGAIATIKYSGDKISTNKPLLFAPTVRRIHSPGLGRMAGYLEQFPNLMLVNIEFIRTGCI